METATNPTTGERLVLIGDLWKPFTASATGPQGAKAFLVDNSWVGAPAPAVEAPAALVDQIPDTPSYPIGDKTPAGGPIVGAYETAKAVGSGLLTGMAAPVVGLYGDLTSGNVANRAQSQRAGMAKMGEFIERNTYQPITQSGQDYTGAVNNVLASTVGATPVLAQFAPLTNAMRRGVTQVANDVRAGAGPALNTAREAALPVPYNKGALASSRAIQASDMAWGDSQRLDAANDASRLNLAVEPNVVNPTTGNKINAYMVGPHASRTEFVKQNEIQLPTIARKELGLSSADALDTAGFNKALKNTTESYREIEALPTMQATDEVFSTVNKLRPGEHLAGEKATFDRVNGLINDVRDKIERGMTGAQVIDNIKNLRAEANAVYEGMKKGPTDPVQLMLAKTKMGLANAFELMIEENLPTSDLVARFRADRTQAAKVYAYKTATNVGQGKINPTVLAAMTEADNALTGDIAAVSRVINNFPEGFFRPDPALTESVIRRYGIGAILGGAVGSAVGNPLAGVVAGGLAGRVAAMVMAKRMASPAYQRAHAMPPDPRMAPLPEPRAPLTNALVPYTHEGAVSRDPNWVPGQVPPEITPEVPPVPPNRLAPPTGEATAANVLRQRAGEAQSAQFRDIEAAQRVAAQEAATRRPAGYGQMFEFDEAGRLRPEATRQPAGAIQVISDTSRPLQSAVAKLQSGTPFALDAVEKIAWDRTKVELATVEPGLSKLTDKQILGKMMDREWMAQAIQKARDQAKGFDEIARKSTDQQMRLQATARRERMLDVAETIEEQLRRQPTTKLGQGPKTRAARNALRGTDNTNALND